MKTEDSHIRIQDKLLELSNLAKILYPAAKFTKAQVIDYYLHIAPVLLPHLKNRPLTLKRYPGGVAGMFFYEKNCPSHRPDWVKTARVWSKGNNRWMHYCLAQDLPTLVWLANLAALELHPSLSLAKDTTRPTAMVFDLDPGPPANIVQCCQVGLWLREFFDRLGLQSFPKTSGSKGLQVYIPLNTKTSYDATKLFAHELASKLERVHPDCVVSNMKKTLRENKVFVDWSQNDEHKTTVSVYSLRAKEHPFVSTPVTWKEVETCLRKQDPGFLVFDAEQVLARVKRMGDLFEPVLKLKQRLPAPQAVTGPHSKLSEPKTAMVSTALGAYRSKRRFDATPEPRPAIELENKHRFVVQKHHASRLHYDFRLEMEGVLKSWAVPKGPSLDPADKRLAMMVEDHPVSYFDFEGTIPPGNYGAGTVMVWDIGTWEALGDAPAMLRNGNLKFRLHGEKLKGEFVLARMRSKTANRKGTEWLFIKKRDAQAIDDYDIDKFDWSVLTKRSLREIADNAGASARQSKRA